ncbi:MAG: HD domain-containing protein [Patescibacteria group bacterium]|nr:HD domain-containing protein [Patescibacteria group bacterium]
MKLKKFQGALAHLAFDPGKSRGRLGCSCAGPKRFDDDDFLSKNVNLFQVDIVKILNSKALRRASGKTQVFPIPNNPHIRTRQLHTLEVAAVAIPIASILGLNVELCEAIAYGHDIGHAPFGHFGERYITEKSNKPFLHAVSSAIVAQRIERKGSGLNLCFETLQGILTHSGTRDFGVKFNQALPQEYLTVKLADKIAFTFSDYNDAERVGMITEPNDSGIFSLGDYQRVRVAKCIEAAVIESAEKGHVSFKESKAAKKFMKLREWLFEKVYLPINFDVQRAYLDRLLDFLTKDSHFEGCDPFLLISLMTDQEVFKFGEFCNSATIPKFEALQNFGVIEILDWLRGKKFDFSSFDLKQV